MPKTTDVVSTDTLDDLVQQLKQLFTAAPRCHLFRTDQRTYAYDVNTGEIIACDTISIRIIKGLGKPTFEECVLSLVQRYGLKVVTDRLLKLLLLSSERNPPLFSTKPPAIRYHLDFETFQHFINNKLERMCLSLTDMCNMSCKYCVYSGAYPNRPRHSTHFMSKEILELSLKYFVEHSSESKIPSITFYGGEPLLAPSLLHHAVDYLNKKLDRKSYSMGIATNFLCANKGIMSFLRDHNFHLYVSLDGPKEVHDRYRVTTDGRGTFERITSNLRLLKEFDEDFYNENVTMKPTLAPPYRCSEVRTFLENNDLMPKKGTPFLVGNVSEPGTVFKDYPLEFFGFEQINH